MKQIAYVSATVDSEVVEQKWALVAKENRDNFTRQTMGFIEKYVAVERGSPNRVPSIVLVTEKALGFLHEAIDAQQANE